MNSYCFYLQDGRLVDLPLSDAFLKLVCGGEVSGSIRESSTIVTSFSPELLEDVMTSSLLSVVSEESEDQFSSGQLQRSETPWWSGMLELEDLVLVDPGRGTGATSYTTTACRHTRFI